MTCSLSITKKIKLTRNKLWFRHLHSTSLLAISTNSNGCHCLGSDGCLRLRDSNSATTVKTCNVTQHSLWWLRVVTQCYRVCEELRATLPLKPGVVTQGLTEVVRSGPQWNVVDRSNGGQTNSLVVRDGFWILETQRLRVHVSILRPSWLINSTWYEDREELFTFSNDNCGGPWQSRTVSGGLGLRIVIATS